MDARLFNIFISESRGYNFIATKANSTIETKQKRKHSAPVIRSDGRTILLVSLIKDRGSLKIAFGKKSSKTASST